MPNKTQSTTPALTPTMRSFVAEHQSSSIVVPNMEDNITLTETPKMSKRKHSTDATLDTTNKRQTPSPTKALSPNSSQTPRSASKHNHRMKNGIKSVAARRRQRLSSPSENAPPEMPSPTSTSDMATPTRQRTPQAQRRAKNHSSSDMPMLAEVTTTTFITQQIQRRADVRTRESQKNTSHSGQDETSSIFDKILERGTGVDSDPFGITPAPETAYPTPAKDRGEEEAHTSIITTVLCKPGNKAHVKPLYDEVATVLPHEEDGDMAFDTAQTKLFPASWTPARVDEDLSFEDLPMGIYEYSPPETPVQDKKVVSSNKAMEIIEIESDDDDHDRLPDLATILGSHPLDKTPTKKPSKPIPKAKPVKKSTKTTQTPTKKTPKTSIPLKNAVLLQSAPQEQSKAPYVSKDSRFIDHLQASGLDPHPTVDICGKEISVHDLYTLVNEKYLGYENVEGGDLWRLVAAGLGLSSYNESAKDIRRLYCETLISIGKITPVSASKPGGVKRMSLSPLATEDDADDVANLTEQKAIFLSKLAAQAIAPVQDVCGAWIDLHLLWVVVEKLGGFEKVEGDHLWPRVAKMLLFSPEVDEAPEELRRVYTELLLYLDEDAAATIDMEGKKSTKARAPDVKFSQKSFKEFQAALQHLSQNTGKQIDESIEICGKEVHLFDAWAVVKHKLGGYQKVTILDLWNRAATNLGFNLRNAEEKDAGKKLKMVWEVVLCNIYFNISPKNSPRRPEPALGSYVSFRFTKAEASRLEREFNTSNLPSRERKERLAEEMGVAFTSVNNWFYTRSSKENAEKAKLEKTKQQLANGAAVVDLHAPSEDDIPLLTGNARRKDIVAAHNHCSVTGCGFQKISFKYQVLAVLDALANFVDSPKGTERAKDYLKSAVEELIAIGEDGGRVVDEDEAQADSATEAPVNARRGAVPGMGITYCVNQHNTREVEHDCGYTDGGMECEVGDFGDRLDGEEERVDADEVAIESETEKSAEPWDHDKVIAHLKDKNADEIRAQIDKQFGEFIWSTRCQVESKKGQDEVDPLEKSSEEKPAQSVEDAVDLQSDGIPYPAEVDNAEIWAVEHGNKSSVKATSSTEEAAASNNQTPTQNKYYATKPTAEIPSLPQQSASKSYSGRKDGKPFWPIEAQMKKMSVSELTKLVQSHRLCNILDKELGEERGAVIEQSKESPVVEDGGKGVAARSNAVGEGMGDMPVDLISKNDFRGADDEKKYATGGILEVIGSSSIAHRRGTNGRKRHDAIAEDVKRNKLDAEIDKEPREIHNTQPAPVLTTSSHNTLSPSLIPTKIVKVTDFVTYHSGQAIVDEAAAWEACEEDHITSKEFGALATLARGDVSIELFEINCSLFAGEIDERKFKALKEFFVGERSFQELKEVADQREGEVERTVRSGEIGKPMLKALMNRARACLGQDGKVDDEKLEACRMW